MAARTELLYPECDRVFLEAYLPNAATGEYASDSGDDKAPQRPFVTLTFATSLDSALSLAPGVQTALSGPQSKAMTHYLRSRHDAILIGVGTALADNPSLNCRLGGAGGYGGEGLQGQPRPVVIDPTLRWQLSESTKILALAREGRGRAPWIVTVLDPVPEQAALLEACGGQYIKVPVDATVVEGMRLEWDSVLRKLGEKGIGSVMIEGGGNVINSLLAPENHELVDSIVVTIAPTWLGVGGVVVSPSRPHGHGLPMARLTRTRWQQLGDDCVLCGVLQTSNLT